MFRIFLKKKLHSGITNKELATRPSRVQNRRVSERYTVAQQHITLMNDQDILVIRDISLQGFCSDLSQRAFDRFSIGDIYEAKMRHHGEVRTFSIKVAWKREQSVGFEFHEPTKEQLDLVRTLLLPIEIAHSLSLVDAGFMRDQYSGLVWYHGIASDLHIWYSEDSGLSAWQLVTENILIGWSEIHGIKTGTVTRDVKTELGIQEPGQVQSTIDARVDPEKVRFACDVFAALPFQERSSLLRSMNSDMAEAF